VKDYKKWMQDVLFQHHVVTRAVNPVGDVEWCVCPVSNECVGNPLVFGATIEIAVRNFKTFIEFKGEE